MGKWIVVAAVVAAMVAANCVSGQFYSCWGGCYNECFLRSNGTSVEKFACYLHCFKGCVPRTAADYQYYCRSGCHFKLCLPFASGDGGRLEKCYDRCSDLCKLI